MEKQATQQQGAEPKKQKAFPDPELGEGVDIGSENGDDEPNMVSPRDAVLADMDSRIDEERRREIHAEQVELAEATGAPIPEYTEDGAQNVQPMHEQDGNPNSELPKSLQNDPLADYIVMDGDKAMFKTKVDGQDRLVPLETARAQLQKHVAAEVRLQQAAEANKALDQREEQIRQNEAALAQKLKEAQNTSPPSQDLQDPDVSDQDLEDEAHQVVSSLFTGSEDEAVKHLTDLLKKTSQAKKSPQVDTQQIAEQAVAAARQQLEDERAEKEKAKEIIDINAGFEEFREKYADIVADSNLFRYADGLTDEIEVEHPNWTPSQVMAEAGERTRKWVETLKGDASQQSSQPNDRQVRKQQLKPMPQVRSAQKPSGQPKEAPETPQSVMEDVRRARGQA